MKEFDEAKAEAVSLMEKITNKCGELTEDIRAAESPADIDKLLIKFDQVLDMIDKWTT